MLPSGPRYTFGIPSTPQLNTRQLATQILASMQSSIASAQELKVGIAATGCDGLPTINPLNGTTCDGAVTASTSACSLVLYNPQTRAVVTNSVGRSMASSIASCAPGAAATLGGISAFSGVATDCTKFAAKMRTKRRFTDNLGNVYGPDGAYLASGVPAQLETDYVHELQYEYVFDVEYDPPIWARLSKLYLRKLAGMPNSFVLAPVDGATVAQGTIWPSVDDIVSSLPFEALSGVEPFYSTNPLSVVTGLNDAMIGGTYAGTTAIIFQVKIDSTGAVDTFKLSVTGLSAVTGIPIAGPTVPPQSLGYGVTVQFGSPTGHALNDAWEVVAAPNDDVVRRGVAVRGTITTATACVNGGFPNNRVLLTAEIAAQAYFYDASTTLAGRELWHCDIRRPNNTVTHNLVVRDADTLAVLYIKALDTAGTYYIGDPPQKFSFSTNDEGLFFLHCYTVPNITGSPSPYPGHEFGSPDARKVATISVNPATFEPTITELITLESSPRTSGSTFVVASTVP
jgi:hypothetical protein